MAAGDGQPLADQWPEVLHRIRAGGKLCQVYTDRAGAFRVAREHGGKGFVISILERLTDDEAGEFVVGILARVCAEEASPVLPLEATAIE